MEIVGVSRNDRDHSLRGEVGRRFYIPVYRPMSEGYAQFMNYEIRTAADPGSVIQAVRSVLRQVDPALPSPDIHPLAERVNNSLQGERVIAQLSAFFGALALLLACIGLYGVLSYGVALRTNEIGIRMALGADKGAVVGLILRETGMLIAIGLAMGVPIALVCARFVASQLYGLKPTDPLMLAGAIGITIALAIGSGYLPAVRAAQVDPLEALRHE
jgi:ABC-type antimicrobial peptide transport system permease subunit